MAVDRIWHTGFELANNDYDGGPGVIFTGSMAYDSPGRTGNYYLLMGTGRFDFYNNLSSPITQARFNVQFLWGGGVGALADPELFWCRNGGTEIVRIKYHTTDGDWNLWIGTGTNQVDTQHYQLTSGWHRICADIKIAVAGWVYLWVDGDPVLTWDGDTTAVGDVEADNWGIGPITGTRRWGSTEGIDDVTFDNTTGEVAPSDDVDRRYPLLTPDGNGFYTDWSPSAGQNYQNVDEIPIDGDTTYNEDNIDGQKDSYSLVNYAVPSDRKVEAIIPIAAIRKVGPSDPVQASLFAREGGIDDSGLAFAITSSYETYWHRMTTAPDGGLIYQTTVNDLESGAEVVVP